MELQEQIDLVWEDRNLLQEKQYSEAVHETIAKLDSGQVRVAEQHPGGDWSINEWIKKAILLYFGLMPLKETEAGDLKFYDKIPLKGDLKGRGFRVVPHAIARYGSFVAPGAILMPSYVNIGAYVDSGSLVDTWATVGSCAQVGRNVHLSGGVGLGGVLEPLQANPVIIEDDCFIGSRAIIVEGARVCKEAVVGAGVTITASTKIIDVTGPEPVEYRAYVPPRSVVIPGMQAKKFPSGTYQVPVALIIGERKETTDLKTSLNEALREFNVAV